MDKFDNKIENTDDEKAIIQYIISGGQVNISSGNGIINAKQENSKEKVVKQIIINKQYKINQNSQGINTNNKSNGWYILLPVIALILITSMYLQYRVQVTVSFVGLALTIELLTVILYYKGYKSGLMYDKNLKMITTFNIIAVLMILIIIGIVCSLFNNKIDVTLLEQEIINVGIFKTVIYSSIGQYVLFLVGGMLIAAIYLLCILSSDLYIIAVLNLVMEKKGKWFWKWLLKVTFGKSKDVGKYIKDGVTLIILSFILISGIIPYIIGLLIQNNNS